MTALPMAEIQKRLDHAASLHPESSTLADFRVDDRLLKAEEHALRNARRIITPHTTIADLFPDRRGTYITPASESAAQRLLAQINREHAKEREGDGRRVRDALEAL